MLKLVFNPSLTNYESTLPFWCADSDVQSDTTRSALKVPIRYLRSVPKASKVPIRYLRSVPEVSKNPSSCLRSVSEATKIPIRYLRSMSGIFREKSNNFVFFLQNFQIFAKYSGKRLVSKK